MTSDHPTALIRVAAPRALSILQWAPIAPCALLPAQGIRIVRERIPEGSA